ncbi:hypothetical protein B0H21DRAFT_863194 [Amylocystis lapponica]|nr:hypothetical protein B0H21DRAFT_863194 [Amylocystis lapponica]
MSSARSSRTSGLDGRGRRSRTSTRTWSSGPLAGSRAARLLRLAARFFDDTEDMLEDPDPVGTHDAEVDHSSASDSGAEDNSESTFGVQEASAHPSAHPRGLGTPGIHSQDSSTVAGTAAVLPVPRGRRQTNFERDFERSLMPPPRSIPVRSASATHPATNPVPTSVTRRSISSHVHRHQPLEQREVVHARDASPAFRREPASSEAQSPNVAPPHTPTRITRQYAFYGRSHPHIFWLDEWDTQSPWPLDVSDVPQNLSARDFLRMTRVYDPDDLRGVMHELRTREIEEEHLARVRARRAEEALLRFPWERGPAETDVTTPRRQVPVADAPVEPRRSRREHRQQQQRDESPSLSRSTRGRAHEREREATFAGIPVGLRPDPFFPGPLPTEEARRPSHVSDPAASENALASIRPGPSMFLDDNDDLYFTPPRSASNILAPAPQHVSGDPVASREASAGSSSGEDSSRSLGKRPRSDEDREDDVSAQMGSPPTRRKL